jgi:hypothetical protein
MRGNLTATAGLMALAALATAGSARAETLEDAWQLALGADQRLVAAQARTAAADAELEARAPGVIRI